MELEDVIKAIDELTSRADGHDQDIEGINTSLKDFGNSLDELLSSKSDDDDDDDNDDGDTDDEPDFGDAVDLDEKEEK